MVTVALPEARHFAFGVVAGQVVVTALAALVCWCLAGSNAAGSAAIGGGISALANLALVVLAFRGSSGSDARLAARAFFVGEASKLAIMIALFVWVLKNVKIEPGALFAGYLVTFLVYWVALARAGTAPAAGLRGTQVTRRENGDV